MSANADIGDRPLDWTDVQSSNFRDYAIRHFNREGQILNDYWLHYWLNQKLLELNFSSPDAIDATTAIILTNNEINAFAIPGNIIGMNRGLMLAADTEAEFLSVLAHEMAHISLDHFSRISDQSESQTLALAGGILLTLLIAPEYSDLANAILFGSLASTQQAQLNYSRAMELEADQLAQEILKNAQYDAEAGRTFFQKLQEYSNHAYEYLSTHPLGNTRSTRLSSQSHVAKADDQSIYPIIKHLLNNNDAASHIPEINETDAHQWYAHILLNHSRQKSSDKETISALAQLIQVHPSFLPGYALKLRKQLISRDDQLCKDFNQTSKRFENEFATLDVLETLKIAAEQCQHASANYWHAQLLWHAGKEEQAIAFVGKSLKQESQTNQAARLRILLNDFSQRYERFR